MLKKRLLLLGFLLAASILGQIVLGPCLGQSKAAANPNSITNPLPAWTPDTNKSVDNLGGKLASRFILMIVFIAVAGIAVWWFLKKMNTPWLGSKGGQLELLETIHLGSRKAVHVIRAGTKQVLIGSSNDGVRFLCDLTGKLESPADEAKS